MRPEDVILEPILSEKSWRAQEESQYTFRVHPRANKVQIRRAVESLFNVRVERVRTMNVAGKPRRLRFYEEGRTPSWKKAVVQLARGQRINLQQ